MDTLQSILDECKLKGYFSTGQVIDFTEKCFDTKHRLEDIEDSKQLTRNDAIKLALEFVSSQSNGMPEHYHAYAVVLAGETEYSLASEVLLCGLKRFGENIDLLADYLLYAIKSNDEHYVKCDEIFKKLLLHRPQFWNWRAYDFSIDYLLDKIDRKPIDKNCIRSQCLELAQEFQKRIPNSELGYIAEFNIYMKFKEEKRAENILKKALNRNGVNVVQSAIRLAEINVRRNNPQEVLKCVRRIMSDIADFSLKTAPEHIYILSIISKTSQLMNSINAEQGINKALVQDIYSDWVKVKKFEDVDKHLFNTARMLVKLVEVNSDIKFDTDEEL
jgi:hypothetical protein